MSMAGGQQRKTGTQVSSWHKQSCPGIVQTGPLARPCKIKPGAGRHFIEGSPCQYAVTALPGQSTAVQACKHATRLPTWTRAISRGSNRRFTLHSRHGRDRARVSSSMLSKVQDYPLLRIPFAASPRGLLRTLQQAAPARHHSKPCSRSAAAPRSFATSQVQAPLRSSPCICGTPRLSARLTPPRACAPQTRL